MNERYPRYFRRVVPALTLALMAGGLAVLPARADDHLACPTYHTQYDELVHGASSEIITARHRGNFSADLPENSLGAFIASFEQCQPQVETDVRMTADDQLVLFHDTNIGKMLEPAYDPDTNSGPNARLSDTSFEELRAKHLLTIDRHETTYEVPTVTELLTTMDDRNAGSIVTLEIKEPRAIIPTAKAVAEYAESHPASNMLQRVVLKFSMENYPTPSHWIDALEHEGLTETIMVDPVMRPYSAAAIEKMEPLPDVPELDRHSNPAKAAGAWAAAPAELAPLVSITLKDSSDFVETVTRSSESFGNYQAPASLDISNTREGTIAETAAVIHHFGKGIELFVPVPDYVLWRSGPVAGYTVRNTFGDKTPLNVRDAFFNNSSDCCYALADRLNPGPHSHEQADLRDNLDWIFTIAPKVITADDTDSIEIYAQQQGRLNLTARPNPHKAPHAMNSNLAYAIDQVSIPDSSIVELKAWNGGSSAAWQGQVCIWSSHEGYGWATACGFHKASGYTNQIEISVAGNGKMKIKDTMWYQCLAWTPGETEVVRWVDNCDSPNTLWTYTDDHRFLTAEGRALHFGWQDRYYWGVPFAYLGVGHDDSAWAKWNFRR